MTCEASWIQTFTGRKVWPLYMRADDVCIRDIAHSLSMMCRFTGHVKRFYSVADHSIYVADRVPASDRLWALLHDASEAYLVDIPRPLKRHDDFAFYRQAEGECMRVIYERFGLTGEQPASVKVADQRMLATEARDLMAPLHPDFPITAEPYRDRICTMSPAIAEQTFLNTFFILGGDCCCRSTAR